MFCPHCGALNSDDAAVCAACGLEMAQQPQAPEVEQMPAAPPRTSPMAIWSLILGIFGCATCVTGIVGIILGILGLKQTNERPDKYTGSGLAIAGITVSAVSLVFGMLILPALLFPVFARAREAARTAVCQSNLTMLGQAVSMYCTDNNDRLPPADRWCDATLTYTKDRSRYQDPSARTQQECGFAFNSALNATWESDLTNAPATVMIFESDLGWNASGGREAMVVGSRHFSGSNVGYADGHVMKIDAPEVGTLIWQPTH